MGFGVLTSRHPVQFTEYSNLWDLGWTVGLIARHKPWGVRRSDGLIILADPGTEAPEVGGQYSPYDLNLNNRRKVMFESELAAAIDYADVSAAIQKVNANLRSYVQRKLQEDLETTTSVLYECFRRTLYDPQSASFGRLGTPRDAPQQPLELVQQGMAVLNGTSIATILGIHYAFVKIVETLGTDGLMRIVELFWKARLSPDALSPGGSRGRENRFQQGQRDPQRPSHTGGITAEADEPVITTAQSHNRALHTWEPDRANPNEFYLNAVVEDLPFVAGPSGSTGALFRCAMLMANLSGEEAKQYALACVAYLELGGNHSFHEILHVAALAGVPYVPGEYEPSLPEAFKATEKYRRLKAKYIDVFAAIVAKQLIKKMSSAS
ncbi:MAG: hypothetical protein ACRD7E_00060 [Bryobacteraceae bacterium]